MDRQVSTITTTAIQSRASQVVLPISSGAPKRKVQRNETYGACCCGWSRITSTLFVSPILWEGNRLLFPL
ncbi:predicted protein [Lichtheimia corymbifera JMRC:FSU:9682]|uniref:Uncharacterized protein n=1 Tax=Lichtheimia corymbifera JMRC:FSU:9682 TaxID=1263082 RepID=A0A068RYM2_9FUNG|nr:predicted protein [Lichtheimia corymbifera JMRC:FSU:9682]